MQVEQTAGRDVAATRADSLVDIATAPPKQPAITSSPVTTASPLSGGRRTVSISLFTEVEDDADLSPTSFAGMVARKTRDLSKSLISAFEAARIPTDEPMTFTLDASGNVIVDSPYKERVEKYLKENPELVKQIKDVAALNSMLALNEAMRRFAEAKKNAKTDEEVKQAETDYTADCMTVQSLSGTMVLADGQLTSGALSYMNDHD